MAVFKTAAFNHSATTPGRENFFPISGLRNPVHLVAHPPARGRPGTDSHCSGATEWPALFQEVASALQEMVRQRGVAAEAQAPIGEEGPGEV